MRIGVISDTHGSLRYFEQALLALGNCDYIIHGGDVLYHGPRNPLPEGYQPKELAEKINTLQNIFFARGNCDADVDQMVINHPIQSPYLLLQLGKFKVLVCHGYTKEKSQYLQMAKDYRADILILGHTHVKELFKEEDLVVLNPGSTSLPKDSIPSAAIIEDNKIQLINIENQEIIKELNLS
ncbi:phosphodiesterase [Desulforamulus ferrireducens]|uniref:Phosphoesterase n=1 Tax=Desulforamulus ferrireducens TaxID=1833852 RepID=A0A1S6IUB6_9FIRM|nr:phosphodiesterase [Desulforamulus ferrireducens]AQS58366.1 YfcE family phosphodiesterase [Desulforamulus ferrireducens]